MPRHLLALGVCAGVAVMVVAAHGIALSRMLYLLAGLIFAGNLFAALAFDYWSMLAARFIAGLPHGAYFGVGAIVATSLAAPGQASRDVCLMVTGMTIANLVGVPLGSFLAWSLSWRATFAVVACVALLLILALRLWMPHVPALPNKGFRAQFRFLGHLTPWLVLGAIGLGNGGFFACYSYVNPIMETVASVPTSLMSAVIALAGFGMVAGNLLSARLAGRFSDQALAWWIHLERKRGRNVLAESRKLVFAQMNAIHSRNSETDLLSLQNDCRTGVAVAVAFS